MAYFRGTRASGSDISHASGRQGDSARHTFEQLLCSGLLYDTVCLANQGRNNPNTEGTRSHDGTPSEPLTYLSQIPFAGTPFQEPLKYMLQETLGIPQIHVVGTPLEPLKYLWQETPWNPSNTCGYRNPSRTPQIPVG